MDPTRRLIRFLAVLVSFWCALIVSAPLGRVFLGDSNAWSANVYSFFSLICHQIDERSFHLLGYKFAVCIRCFSIYAGFLVSLTIQLLRGRVPLRIPNPKFIIAAVLPMVLDVLLDTLGIKASTPFSRALTGAIFGAAAPTFILPPLVNACRQLQLFPFSQGALLHAAKTE